MITTRLIRPGVIEVTIAVAAYGQAGRHWRDVLVGPNHGGFGRIFIDRFDTDERRRSACSTLRPYYRGEKGANLDECPGAMFVWEGDREADVEPIDAIDNQTLGRALMHALKAYKQKTREELWEVVFRFA